MKRLCLLTALLTATFAQAATIEVMIGDNDGFGGVHGGGSSSPGQVFDPGNISSSTSYPTLAPGTHFNESATDAATASPWTGYIFVFEFNWDTSGLASVGNAQVTVQSGSVGRRDASAVSTGFGTAQVSANDILDLGDFLTVPTGAAGSAAEETVKAHVFDVTSLIGAGTSGLLSLKIDGSNLSNPVDLFALDFATLSIQGDTAGAAAPVPEPSTLVLLGLGLCGLGVYRRAA